MDNLIQTTIINKYGSINNFVDQHYTDLPVSRNHVYLLVNYRVSNPGVFTLEKLAKLLDLPKEAVINDYFAGYRDRRTER